MTSDMIARLINQDMIHILINLNGYTKVIIILYNFLGYLHWTESLTGGFLRDLWLLVHFFFKKRKEKKTCK